MTDRHELGHTILRLLGEQADWVRSTNGRRPRGVARAGYLLARHPAGSRPLPRPELHARRH